MYNIDATITLPAGLGLAAGETATHTVGTITGSSPRETVWSIQALQEGTWTYTVTCTYTVNSQSESLNASSSVQVPVLDSTAPVTTSSLSPGANGAGWNNTNVTVNLTATDEANGSGVKEIHYQVGANPQQVVSGASASASVTTEGATVVYYWAIDNAGNTETQKSVTVNIDKTAPAAASISASPASWTSGNAPMPPLP